MRTAGVDADFLIHRIKENRAKAPRAVQLAKDLHEASLRCDVDTEAGRKRLQVLDETCSILDEMSAEGHELTEASEAQARRDFLGEGT